MTAQVQAYLERISYNGSLVPDVALLASLQFAHLTHIPYENLDILHKVPLSLEIPDLFEKIILRKRGGYCFEINVLYAWLLRELGFCVTDIFARFHARTPAGSIPMRRHRVLKVEPPNGGTTWLCDVGIGMASPTLPLPFGLVEETDIRGTRYRVIEARDGLGYMLEDWNREQWREIYSFTDERQFDIDFQVASFFCEHSPQSIFIHSEMVSLRTSDGRKTLDGDVFKVFAGDTVETHTATSPSEKAQLLAERFGIVTDFYK